MGHGPPNRYPGRRQSTRQGLLRLLHPAVWPRPRGSERGRLTMATSSPRSRSAPLAARPPPASSPPAAGVGAGGGSLHVRGGSSGGPPASLLRPAPEPAPFFPSPGFLFVRVVPPCPP